MNSEYTNGWTWYSNDLCNIPESNIITISEFPNKLEENMIYILDTGKILVNDTVIIWNCTAVIWLNSPGKTLVDSASCSGDVFVIAGKHSIIDNLEISWNQKSLQYWIRIQDTNNVTLNNIKIQWLFGGIYSEDSHYSNYNNIYVSDVFQYPFILKDSNYNLLTNISLSNSADEAGFHIEWSSFNNIKNIKSFKNTYQWLYIKSWSNNLVENAVIDWNTSVWIRIRNGSGNKIYNSTIFDNKREWVLLSSDSNYLSNITSYWNPFGIVVSSNNNIINNCIVFNNTWNGVHISWGEYNSFTFWYIYNNNLNWIELVNSNYNNFSNIHDFNNWKQEGKSGRCWISLYNKSSENSFTDIYIYNNIIWICSNKSATNIFKNVKTFNNKTAESIAGNLSWAIIKTWINIKTGILQKELTWKINSWINSIVTWNILIKTGVKLSFEYMINPHVKNHYLLNWESSYADNIWFKSGFLGIKENEPEYSIGIMLQDEITGHVISNWKNVVANWKIDSFEIWKDVYNGNRIKYPLDINPWDVENTVATNINGKDIHAMLVLDIEGPICEVEYSTTWETTENVIATLTWCSEEIAWTDFTYPFTKNGTHTFEFTDLVGNSWSTEANVSRIKPKPSWNGGWWWGWWWGGGSVNNETNNTATNSWNNNSKFSFNTWNFDSDYSEEMNMAYQYAYHYKITTQKSISEAWMDHGLTRIAMAKMLSMYAINVLWKKPANVIVPEFFDVSNELDDQYDNWLTLAYQLGIMWINIPNNEFRPYDLVTRAEFATALSRLLYWTVDWTDTYYSTHLNKLLEKWIIANTDPDLQELRWYVMIMLMRSALGIKSVEDFVYPEPEPQEQEIVKYFTEPYKKGQIYSRIWDLQDLLRYLGYYKYWTNYVYSKATINAVYDFQVAMGLIDADDVNNPARWYLWPETRNALNEKRAEFQQYKNWIANE